MTAPAHPAHPAGSRSPTGDPYPAIRDRRATSMEKMPMQRRPTRAARTSRDGCSHTVPAPAGRTRCPGFVPFVAGTLISASMALPVTLPAQDPLVGRPAVEALRFPSLRFQPPEPKEFELTNGIKVFYMEDRSLPLVYVFARFRGGSAHFDRSLFAAATAVPALLRTGGTTTLPPDSVDKLVEFYALGMSFGSGGQSSFASLNTLTRHADFALRLWTDMLRNPRFDSAQVEIWRTRELESVRRRPDNPQSLAFSEFNHLMFGEHPVGWIMEPGDLEPEDLSPDKLRRVHRQIFCRENATLGITGDIGRQEARAALDAVLGNLPRCPRTLPEPPSPRIRRQGGVFLIPKALEQSTIVMGQPGGIRQRNHRDYFASRVANSILGASGFTSRILSRARTEKGYAYSASSFWTAPLHYEGVVGALTQTKSSTTLPAIRLIRQILQEMLDAPPLQDEVRVAIDDFVNGFVFNFEDPAAIIARRMSYVAAGLPSNWPQLFLDGVQRVTPADVRAVMRRYVRPDHMTILVVGDSTRFGEPLSALGPVTVIQPEGVSP